MKAFNYDGTLFIRAIPGKQLFRSSMVHEVVNRGDIFALRADDQVLTIVPGKAEVQHLELTTQQAEEAKQRLAFVRQELIMGMTLDLLIERAQAAAAKGLISSSEGASIIHFLHTFKKANKL